MPAWPPSASSPLKENIFFLTVSSFASSLCILAFDGRLYTAGNVVVLFLGLLVLFIIQAFAGSMKDFVTTAQILFFYGRAFALAFVLLAVWYSVFLPFPF